ncbi:probable Protein transport protein SEC24 [Saccharomycodes ludwigii]|uniref:Probable Protein transport protein SEC24 n=1 Tax=Saccharomycodes ludwigii TaxID=36035 RepID=A0A376B7B5_9ASCO|nr:probable Protein transport protein SEC24 [Saccharomycodes ludwigii]
MSGHRKRVYPKAQFDYSNPATISGGVPPPQVPGQQVPFQPQVSQQQFMTPIQQQLNNQIDQTTQQVANMNLYGNKDGNFAPQYNINAGSPVIPQQQQIPLPPQQEALQHSGTTFGKPMNQLYPVDLLTELPPPITDLELPPPPLVVPNNKVLYPSDTVNKCTDYLRCTLNAIPKTNALLKKSKLPFALVIRPFTELDDDDEEIPINTDTVLVRCRRCRCYLNPFVTLIQDGRRWRCNFCNLANDFPLVDNTNFATQILPQRPEMFYSVVDHLAPPQYSVRAPPPSVYCFILDCSHNAIKNGLLATSARTILESLDSLPNRDDRTRIAILCVDNALHYFSVPTDDDDGDDDADADADGDDNQEKNEKDNIKMLDVGDLTEPFLPLPESLLVPLLQCRSNLEKLLNAIPEIFQFNISPKFALAPALRAARNMIKHIGGKIIVCSSTLPNTDDEGALKPRSETGLANTKKEASTLLTPQSGFYKSFTIDCNKSQITIDLFLASDTYIDVATQSNLARYTAGQTHFYPGWSATNLSDVTKFTKEFSKHITMDLSMEAVVRARGTSGLKMSGFYGHFFNRSSDLCAFPTVPRDQAYVFEVSIEETIVKEYCYFQVACLMSSNAADRRIRVITIALPTTDNIGQVYASADQLALTKYFAVKAVHNVISTGFEETREYLDKQVQDILSTYKGENVVSNTAGGAPLRLCANLRMLPLLMHALTKNMAFRKGVVPSDHRAAALNNLESIPLENLIKSIYPTVYSLHDMPDEAGLPEEESGEILLPQPINATMSLFEKYGLYLMDTNNELFLWVGGDSVNELIMDVFGTPNIFEIPIGKNELPALENSEFNTRVRNIVSKIRESSDVVTYKNLYIVRGAGISEPVDHPSARELSSLRLWVGSYLVEDKVLNTLSYREYLQTLKNKITK